MPSPACIGMLLMGSAGLLVGVSSHPSTSAPGLHERAFGRALSAGTDVTRLELELDLRNAPQLRGIATLHGTSTGTEPRELEFQLNRALRVDRVVQDGAEVKWSYVSRMRRAHRDEARVVVVERAPRDGAWSLRVEYSGRGSDGKDGRDWMGILLLAADELRMSVQTVFYPQVGADPDGPGVAPLPASVRVLAPEGFEVYVPGKQIASAPAEGGGTSWRFDEERPTVLSLFAARRVRNETQLGDARVVTLLRDEHAQLAESITREARQILEAYAQMWGPIGGRTLGVCEIDGRGQSYNWASQGIVTIDRHAFGNAVPVPKLAHEIAHLWWGQEVVASGRGERFLTESFAEYASWRYLARAHGAEEGLVLPAGRGGHVGGRAHAVVEAEQAPGSGPRLRAAVRRALLRPRRPRVARVRADVHDVRVVTSFGASSRSELSRAWRPVSASSTRSPSSSSHVPAWTQRENRHPSRSAARRAAP